MATYEYNGRNAQQKTVIGKMKAESTKVVAETLLKDGITPITIVEVSSGQSAIIEFFKRQKRGRVKTEELVVFCRQMYTLLKAGVPIVKILLRLAETIQSPRLAEVLAGAVETISAGQPLTAALKQYPDVFEPIFVSVVETGESSGQLDEVFLQLAGYMELKAETLKQIKTATRYPVMIMIAVTVAFAIVNVFVVPAFADFFKQFGAELPLPTKILIGTSNFVLNYWPFIIIAGVGIFLGIRYLFKIPKVRFLWDQYKLKFPIFGSLINQVALSRFARTFAIIMRTGIPLIKGIELVANAVGNVYISDRIMMMRDAIQHGETLTSVAVRTKLFTPLVIQMLSVGEESGSIDTLLGEIADFYEREVDYNLKRLGDLIEPVLLAVMALFVLGLALGVFLPMWDMASLAKR